MELSEWAKNCASLPSGVRVGLGKADPNRPWEISGSGNSCIVRRERRGDSSAYESYRGGRPSPLIMSEQDAAALVELLNSNIPMRKPRATPTGWR